MSDHGLTRVEYDRLARVFANMPDHVDNALNQPGEFGALSFNVIAARKVE